MEQDNQSMQLFRQELIKHLNGKTKVEAKYTPSYPYTAEREYFRLVNSYMTIEKAILQKYIPELKQILSEGTQYNTDSKRENMEKRKTARFSEIDNTIVRLNILFKNIQRELEGAIGLLDLKRKVQEIATLDHKLTVKEWKKVIGKTLGINIMDDYYSGVFYQEMIEKWISENVDLIKTVPKESLGKIKRLVYESFMKGKTNTDIIREIQRQYGIDKRHARLIARDQTGKLNAQITRHQQKDAGVNEYIWMTCQDERVRDSHIVLHGEKFSWDAPPDVGNGRCCHPGEDYQCRCRAKPVFDVSKVNIDSPVQIQWGGMTKK